MGILNVTPDSFSDGGEAFNRSAAIEKGLALFEEGADIVDIGGESTRPGAEPVEVEEELTRVIPVVEAVAKAGPVSVDTRRAEVMAAAIRAGASIVNDVTALTGDGRALEVVAATSASVVLMHMQGEPQTMQVAPRYADVAAEVRDWLAARVATCRAAGIAPARIAIDPGIGFGKTFDHNLELLRRLDLLRGPGHPVVLGVSRKGFIGHLTGVAAPRQRFAGSVAAGLWAAGRGVHILRVHDVAETRQALAVWRAIAHTM